MIKIRRTYNNDCLKCQAVEKEMVSIGAFVMCKNCAITEFDPITSDIPRGTTRIPKYHKWLKIYKEKK